MQQNTTGRRMTLRQMLTHTEKCARDLYDHVSVTMLNNLSDFRDLTRPVRRRSHYPKVIAVANSLKKVEESYEEAQALARRLEEFLTEVREHAKRELVNRL